MPLSYLILLPCQDVQSGGVYCVSSLLGHFIISVSFAYTGGRSMAVVNGDQLQFTGFKNRIEAVVLFALML